MGSQGPIHAEAIPPLRSWEAGGPSRIRGTRLIAGERPSGTLPDEILTPGKGRIRALLIDGGDPLTSWPDQRKTAQAMADLELLVTIDPWPNPTTSFAHYILPPFMQYERADLPMLLPGYACWPGGWAQYTPPIIPPPPGSDLVHDADVFWAIAKRLGKTIVYNGVKPLCLDAPPTADELIELVMHGAPISLDELKKHPHGIDVPIGGQTVQPPQADCGGYFEPMPVDVADELRRYLASESRPGRFVRDNQAFTHLLASRRMRDLFNSNGRYLRTVRKRTPYNPAFLHPSDAAALNLNKGDRIEIQSAHARVTAIVDLDDTIKPGVVSMAHGWGPVPGSNEDPAVTGSAVNALIDNDRNFEPVNAMPHMSAVPVNIRPLA
jgi:anaerobic selenocysteine-containing dehydrogenase